MHIDRERVRFNGMCKPPERGFRYRRITGSPTFAKPERELQGRSTKELDMDWNRRYFHGHKWQRGRTSKNPNS